MALGAVTARNRDSRGCGSGADRSRRGGADGCDLRPGGFQSPAVHRGFGPLRDGAAVLRLAPARLCVQRVEGSGVFIRIFHSRLAWGSCCWKMGVGVGVGAVRGEVLELGF